MTKAPDYSEFTKNQGPTGEDLANLSALVDEMVEAERRVAEAEERLKEEQNRLKTLRDHDIPTLMENAGIAEGSRIVTASGYQVELARNIQAGIAKARQEEAFEWLERNGHGGLIKRNVVVGFGRGQDEEAERLRKLLEEGEFENVRDDQSVHYQTLRGFVRERLEQESAEDFEGTPLPRDLFGVVELRSARVKPAK